MNTVTPPSKRALVFFSSPNKTGFTHQLLTQAMAQLPADMTYEFIDVFATDIKPCIDCKVCFKQECPFNDDGMREILKKVQQCDIIIAATPIYFNSVPAKFKAIFDRMQQLFVQKVLLHKPVFTTPKQGILLTTAGAGDDFATKSIYAMFQMFFSSLNAEMLGHIAITNTDSLEEVVVDKKAFSAILSGIKEK